MQGHQKKYGNSENRRLNKPRVICLPPKDIYHITISLQTVCQIDKVQITKQLIWQGNGANDWIGCSKCVLLIRWSSLSELTAQSMLEQPNLNFFCSVDKSLLGENKLKSD